MTRPTTVDVSLGSDDALRLWCNGDLVLDENVRRGVAPDQNRATLGLRAGSNTVLLKIVNDGGPGGMYFRMIRSGPPDDVLAEVRAKLAEGRTTIAIAHRLSTAARADRVLLLDGGRLVEDGHHDDLLAAGGPYAALYDAWLTATAT